MDFYLIFSSILPLPPSGKWVPLGHTVEGGFEKYQLIHQRFMASDLICADKHSHP